VSFPIAVLTGVVDDDECVTTGDVIESCQETEAQALGGAG
jgi:hypothetical protein